MGDTREHDRHKRIEAEANRFAAHLLMPPARIRSSVRSRQPDISEIVRLAGQFGVSREAMARGYIEAHRDTLAVVILHRGLVDRIYRPEGFPWIEPRRGQPVPEDSIASDRRFQPGQISEMEECEPETWFGEHSARSVEVLSEQLLALAAIGTCDRLGRSSAAIATVTVASASAGLSHDQHRLHHR